MGVLSLVIFIAVTIGLNVFLKRQISEALLVALFACALVAGTDAPRLLWNGIYEASQSDITFAGMAFVFMGIIVNETGLITRLITILDSIFGRLRGGSAYVSTLGSAAIGLVAGSTAGNTATVGTVTIPWMKRSGWTSTRAATLVAGNSGLGVSLPPNSTMFILLALPIASQVSQASIYISLLVAGAYATMYRLVLVFIWTRTDNIPRTDPQFLQPFRTAWREGWTSTLIFVGILLPVLLSFGPLYNWLVNEDRVGEAALKAISIIVWVPILISIIAIVEGWNRLPKTPERMAAAVKREIPQFATVGVSLFAALAATGVMSELGVGENLADFLNSLDLPKPLIIAMICLLVIIVATPLSSTATVSAIGVPALAVLVALDVPIVVAMVTILLCSSTEGASPPAGAPIYLASGLAETDPVKTFIPLIMYFVLPIALLAWLVAMGILPIPQVG